MYVSVRMGILIKGPESCDQRKNITRNKKCIFDSAASFKCTKMLTELLYSYLPACRWVKRSCKFIAVTSVQNCC